MFQGRIEEKMMWMKKPQVFTVLFVSSTHKKLHNQVVFEGNVCSTQGQIALTAVASDLRYKRVCLVYTCLLFLRNR